MNVSGKEITVNKDPKSLFQFKITNIQILYLPVVSMLI